ncbi:MAG TPA: TadE/TadG family type IV pilus assembly protein, partial [Anaerolineales bacterium]|nr:TadE/TadG family type IV pilus assembly protein [Anaerolineales bacterium]
MKLNTFAPKKSRAQAMVEFAIVLPLLLLLLYGLLEAGRLLFIYSTIVTATRQASRYGSATGSGGDYTPIGGPNNSSIQRYEDCYGIRQAAQRVDFLNAFDDEDITINYDSGPGTGIDDTCDGIDGNADPDVDPSADNDSRIVVTIDGDYHPIVPRIVPFLARTVAGGNPISATSARTIVVGVAIEVSPLPGSGGPPPPGTFDLQLDMTADKSTYAFEGEVVNFTYTLTNNGDVEITGITFTVTHGSWNCPGTSLAAGASMTCTGSYTTTAADLTAGSVVAQATATGTDGTNTITSNTGSVTLTFVVIPELNLLKTASTEYATTGGAVTYTFTLTNTGNVPLSPPFTVTDNLMTVSCPTSGDLAPSAATACTGTYTLTAGDIEEDELVNTARASAMYGTQTINSNQSSVTVWTGPLFLRASAAPASLSAPG